MVRMVAVTQADEGPSKSWLASDRHPSECLLYQPNGLKAQMLSCQIESKI